MSGFYVFTKMITFPGAILRGFWQHIICRICKIPVEDNRTLRSNEMCGHVEHTLATTPRQAFALCYVPVFMNLLLALTTAPISAFRLIYMGDFSFPKGLVDVVALWLAFSAFVNCAPLREDAANAWHLLYANRKKVSADSDDEIIPKKANIAQKIFYFPGAVFCSVSAVLDRLGLSFVLGIIPLIAVLALIIAI